MSGHSKWATTKRAKAVVDAKRGTIFTKMSNLISIAARKGGDPEINFQLRLAIDKAREANMPKDNIERAIKRGTGEGGGGPIEELVYEGIGPAQSQFIIRVLTDSRNRAAATIRHIFSKYGGSLGAVMWNFELKGVLMISKEVWLETKLDWDEFLLEGLEAGVEDGLVEDEGMVIYTKPENFAQAKKWLEEKKISTALAEIEYVAKEKITLSESDQEKVTNFIEALEGDEDVSDYFTNIH
ncbi:MAG TPA: YebC/PmpR family DNA-binding transcriptional regulator [bacterium]|jgi:YebC/PmpR family DNA-binding regulatory protein|nr:YebC/PmpR family DNA-binding transcriptional regulator [bacterium]